MAPAAGAAASSADGGGAKDARAADCLDGEDERESLRPGAGVGAEAAAAAAAAAVAAAVAVAAVEVREKGGKRGGAGVRPLSL